MLSIATFTDSPVLRTPSLRSMSFFVHVWHCRNLLAIDAAFFPLLNGGGENSFRHDGFHTIIRIRNLFRLNRKDMARNMVQTRSAAAPTDGELSIVVSPREVADVMTSKVITLRPHHEFNYAVKLMNDRTFRHCVVVDGGGKLVGIISDRDILRALARYSNWQSKTLEQIMTPTPYVVKRNTPISDAVAKMLGKRINCLPVVTDDGTVCGIVTSTDLLRSYKELIDMMQKRAG